MSHRFPQRPGRGFCCMQCRWGSLGTARTGAFTSRSSGGRCGRRYGHGVEAGTRTLRGRVKSVSRGSVPAGFLGIRRTVSRRGEARSGGLGGTGSVAELRRHVCKAIDSYRGDQRSSERSVVRGVSADSADHRADVRAAGFRSGPGSGLRRSLRGHGCAARAVEHHRFDEVGRREDRGWGPRRRTPPWLRRTGGGTGNRSLAPAHRGGEHGAGRRGPSARRVSTGRPTLVCTAEA